MPNFTIQVFHQPNGQETPLWANTYHVVSDDIYAARSAAEGAIVPFEVAIHSPFVYFKEVRISTTPADGFTFITVPLNIAGALVTAGDQLPKFLALRMDLLTSVGRSGRKFYHLLPGEGDQAGGQWSTPLKATVTTNFATMLAALADYGTVLTNESGTSTYDAMRVYDLVTEHQFKRKWARRHKLIP